MSAIRSHGNAATELRIIALFCAHHLAVFVDSCFWRGSPIHATQPKSNAAFWRKNGARQRVDGHDAGVAPQRSAGVAVGGRPLGVNGHKSPPTAPATASSPAPSARSAGACCGFGSMSSSGKTNPAASPGSTGRSHDLAPQSFSFS